MKKRFLIISLTVLGLLLSGCSDTTSEGSKNPIADESNSSILDEDNSSTSDESNSSILDEDNSSTSDESNESIVGDNNTTTSNENEEPIIDENNNSTSDNTSSPVVITPPVVSTITIEVIRCDNSNALSATDDCGSALVSDYYTCIQDGDSLVKESSNTTVKLLHDSQNNKKVCVQTGTAYLIR